MQQHKIIKNSARKAQHIQLWLQAPWYEALRTLLKAFLSTRKSIRSMFDDGSGTQRRRKSHFAMAGWGTTQGFHFSELSSH